MCQTEEWRAPEESVCRRTLQHTTRCRATREGMVATSPSREALSCHTPGMNAPRKGHAGRNHRPGTIWSRFSRCRSVAVAFSSSVLKATEATKRFDNMKCPSRPDRVSGAIFPAAKPITSSIHWSGTRRDRVWCSACESYSFVVFVVAEEYGSCPPFRPSLGGPAFLVS